MIYNIHIFSDWITWNDTISCALCNFPKLIQSYTTENPSEVLKIWASEGVCYIDDCQISW